MAAKKTGPVVHVIFDTSCLFVDAADKLIGDEIGEFVLSTNEGLEIDVHWHLPQLVVDERKYQMNLRANKLLPHIEKVEKLLGHNLAITPEILKGGVDGVIQRELEKHSLNVLELDTQSVGWPELIQRAVTRQPPFDPAEKQEKGFRDAVILETFCQLVEKLPKTAQSCRIVFVCADGLLADARKRATDRTNLIVTGGLSDLKTMLNALASQLTDETLTKILPLAKKMFFDAEAKTGMWLSEKLSAKIRGQYGAILDAAPWPDFKTGVIRRLVSTPAFLTKKGQTLAFSSRITYQTEAKKVIWRNLPPPPRLPGLFGSSTESVSFGSDTESVSFGSGGILGTSPPSPGSSVAGSSSDAGMGLYPWLNPPPLSSPPQFEEIRRTGEHVFEVTWSVVLTARGKLTKAKVDGIEHKGTNWEEPS